MSSANKKRIYEAKRANLVKARAARGKGGASRAATPRVARALLPKANAAYTCGLTAEDLHLKPYDMKRAPRGPVVRACGPFVAWSAET